MKNNFQANLTILSPQSIRNELGDLQAKMINGQHFQGLGDSAEIYKVKKMKNGGCEEPDGVVHQDKVVVI